MKAAARAPQFRSCRCFEPARARPERGSSGTSSAVHAELGRGKSRSRRTCAKRRVYHAVTRFTSASGIQFRRLPDLASSRSTPRAPVARETARALECPKLSSPRQRSRTSPHFDGGSCSAPGVRLKSSRSSPVAPSASCSGSRSARARISSITSCQLRHAQRPISPRSAAIFRLALDDNRHRCSPQRIV